MNSFNHYAYGAVGAWLYSTVLGWVSKPELQDLQQPVWHRAPVAA